MKEEFLITTIATSNAILVFMLTVLFIREWNRRRALEELLRQSMNYWRTAHEAKLEGRDLDRDLPDDERLPW
jgi:hypothetical protein